MAFLNQLLSIFKKNDEQVVDLKTKKILLVEDETFLAQLIQEALRKQQIEVDIISEGGKVIETLQQTPYDIILLDLGLPGKEGTELLKEIKESPNLSSIPVIILTNFADMEHIHKCKQYGADDYLIKSQIDYTKIKDLIFRNLEKDSIEQILDLK